MVASAATIAACASSSANKPLATAPDPVVETRTVVRRECPPELLGAIPAKPVRPACGVGRETESCGALDGDAATLGWVGQLARWGDKLRLLLTDAAAQCS
jgi:hypothetical protein